MAFGGDVVLWAAWLYYVEGRTQNDVAAALGVSRASVANYIAEARRRKLVRIELAPDLLARVEASKALAAKFGLEEVHVAPVPAAAKTRDGAAAARRAVGGAAAHLLACRLGDGVRLGVAWGRTMLDLARALPEMELPGATVAQMSGSSLLDNDSSPEACTTLIAARLGARCRNFHAPSVVRAQALRDALIAEPSIQRQFALLRRCDLVVFGVGEVDPALGLADAENAPPGVIARYAELGARAALIGRFINEAGAEVPGPLDGRRIGMSLNDLRAVPARVMVVGGEAKKAAIRAALAGGYATHLVVDAGTAGALLEEDGP